ncbi:MULTISPECIES: response regulator transcription factor [Streptomyces]|uniref:response regulator transcription factor n=1 Tax=Streptomyces TaxID=1883 RepID=UPI0022495CAD|nr:response regulator transcription factor [Streptomyces sp. JHD 1]MCX2968308.1 response regulator transcription factor [Streptomyces sp. JHD 1]
MWNGHEHPTPRILVASACASVDVMKRDLARHGYDAEAVASGRAVLETHHDYDFILLDTDLPDLDGVSLCRALRQDSDVPIIGFTSNESEVDRVLLLEAGCDDCVDIPYRARELVARIKAILRRTEAARGPRAADPGEGERLEFGPLVIDPARREACLHGRGLPLTRKEFDLLHTLATEPERVFRRRELMFLVWDYPAGNRISAQASRTIDTHVSSLRGKLGHSEWVTTVRGVGFRFGVSAPGPDAAVPGAGADRPELGEAEEPLVLRPRLVSLRTANGSARQGSW